MSIKKIEIRLSKFYLLTWIFGLATLLLTWFQWYITAGVMFYLFLSYSIADIQNPPIENENDSDKDDIKPA